MDQPQALLTFSIGNERYALPVEVVERTAQIAEVTPLPGAPEVVSGVIDVAGEVIPAISVRARLGRPERELSLDGHFCLACTKKRRVALIVDRVDGVIHCGDGELVAAETVVPGLDHVRGIVRLKDGLVLVNDVDAFLSLEEHRQIDKAMKKSTPGRARKS